MASKLNGLSKAEIRDRREQQEAKAWELHLQGVPQIAIAAELSITQARVSQYIKKVAQRHPVVQMSLEERLALGEARWQMSEDELREQIHHQRLNGRVVTRTITDPGGRITTEVTKTQGVDPALLRALSTHHDRRARQLNNQLSPDAGMQQVNVNVVKEFLGQADGQGKLSAADWNDQQSAVDV